MENKIETRYPQVLLLGNGINQLGGGGSWSDFLRAIATKAEIVNGKISVDDLKCPEPLKAILVTDDHVDVAMRKYCGKIAFSERSEQAQRIFQKLLTMGFDDILTTNYTYELELAASDSKQIGIGKITKLMRHTNAVPRAEGKYLLHTYNLLTVDGCTNRVWHIHGEARKPDSTVLGHYYYGNLLYKIKESLFNRNYAKDNELNSWVDAFILGDVYVLGFGFGFAEMDLWWLLNRKGREKTPTGKIFFYTPEPSAFDEKHELLRMLKEVRSGEPLVEIISCGYREKTVIKDGHARTVLDGSYENYYGDAILDIEKRMKGRKHYG